MKINPISSTLSAYQLNFQNRTKQNIVKTSSAMSDVFVKSNSVSVPQPLQVSFMGKDVHIVGAGNELHYMKYLTKTFDDSVYVVTHNYDQEMKNSNMKPLQALEQQLKMINEKNLVNEDSFVAIPVEASVPLMNIGRFIGWADEFHEKPLQLTPETTLQYRDRLLEELGYLYRNKDSSYIKELDPEGFGIEYAYGVIEQINKLKTRKVYIPVELPSYKSLKWMANEHNQNEELEKFMGTNWDENYSMHYCLEDIHNKGWYDLNLLALARNVKVVNLKETDGITDHPLSAYDATINDGASGFINVSPVRDADNNLKGFSFKDMKTNQYPLSEFPNDPEIETLTRFVGLKSDSGVIADGATTYEFKRALYNHEDLSRFSDKLFWIYGVFSDEEIRSRKLNLRGDFVDSSLNKFFRINSSNEIIYPKGDAERNGRPSVKALWGATYSIFNAIRRDVEYELLREWIKEEKIGVPRIIVDHAYEAEKWRDIKKLNKAEYWYQEAAEAIEFKGLDVNNEREVDVLCNLAEVRFRKGKKKSAEELYNFLINEIASAKSYNGDKYKILSKLYTNLVEICEANNDDANSFLCQKAAQAFEWHLPVAETILQRRAEGNHYLGGLFVDDRKYK